MAKQVPAAEDVRKLPKRAQVAFAARCAARAAPIFKRSWHRAPSKCHKAIHSAIDLAQRFAEKGTPESDHLIASKAAYATAASASEAACESASAAAFAAAYAVDSAYSADAAYAAHAAAYAAAFAVKSCRSSRVDDYRLFIELMWVDLRTLVRLSAENRWNDDSPVDLAPLGPLLPSADHLLDSVQDLNHFGSVMRRIGRLFRGKAPQCKAVQDDAICSKGGISTFSALSLSLQLPSNWTPDAVQSDVADLFDALNEWHLSRGGGGLTLDDFQYLMRVAQGVEV